MNKFCKMEKSIRSRSMDFRNVYCLGISPACLCGCSSVAQQLLLNINRHDVIIMQTYRISELSIVC